MASKAELELVIRATDKASRIIARMGRNIGIGVLAGTGVAIAGVAAFTGASVKAFASFEKQMNEVFTLLPGISQAAMNDMEAQVKSFSKEFGVLPEKVIPALYQSLSAGVPSDNVFDFLAVAQKAAVGGVTELETAVDGITSVVNAYGEDVVNATQASDLMFTAVKLGKTTFGELSSSLFNVIPTAAALKVNFGDITAALAAITAQGTPTSVATTQIRAMLVALTREGGKTSEKFKEIAGVGFREFIAQGGNLQEALQLLEGEAARAGKDVGVFFGAVEAANAALALTGEGTDTFTANLSAMTDSAGATQAAFDQMMRGLKPAIDKLKASFAVFRLDFVKNIAPAVLEFANNVLPVLQQSFDDLIESLSGDTGQKISDSLGRIFAVFSGEQDVSGLEAALGIIEKSLGSVETILEGVAWALEKIAEAAEIAEGLIANFQKIMGAFQAQAAEEEPGRFEGPRHAGVAIGGPASPVGREGTRHAGTVVPEGGLDTSGIQNAIAGAVLGLLGNTNINVTLDGQQVAEAVSIRQGQEARSLAAHGGRAGR